jgi:DNA-binding CsgD family transcriptional regulator/tetratricopeptide (TPR) repeat protein
VGASEFKQVVTRHYAAFARLAAEAERRLKGPEQLQWLSRLEGEHDNLRVALACGAAEVPARLQLAINLSWFWNLHSHLSEGRRWLQDLMETVAALPLAPADVLLDASARLAAGSLAYVQDDYPAACSLLEPAILRFREADDRRSLASALNYFGMSAYWQGHKDEARAALHESVSLFRRIGDPWGLAVSLHSLDSLAFDEQDTVTVQRLNEESQALLRQTGDRWALSMPLGSLGKAAEHQGDWRLAEKYLSESLTIQREFSDRQGVAWTLLNLASVALRSGDYARAEALGCESLALYRALNNQGNMIGGALLELGHAALHRSAHAQAAAHFAEALALAKTIDDQPHVADALSGLGSVSLAQEDLSQASSYYWEAMQTRRIVGHRVAIAFAFQDFALLAAMQNQADVATRLFAASQATEEHVRDFLYPMDRAARDHAIRQLQAKLGPRFDELWAAGRALTLEQAVAEAKQLAAGEQTVPPPTQLAPAYPAELTAREVEVLRLVARGLTNRQIADQLVISPRTVNAHLRSIYGKLDVATRTAAARYALEHKLM